MDNRDEFFSELFDEDSVQQKAIKAARQLEFEERVIKCAFTAGGYKPPSWGRLANMCRDATNEIKLNFMWFNTEFPRFPGVLCGSRVPYLHELLIKDVFSLGQPVERKNKLLRRLMRVFEKHEIDATNKFVFAFTITKTLLVAHNLTQLEPPETETSVEIHYRLMNRSFIIEPAKVVFARIGADWARDLA